MSFAISTARCESGLRNAEAAGVPRAPDSRILGWSAAAWSSFAMVLVACALAGCSIDKEPYAEVTGQVTIEGVPAAGVMVTFEPQSEDPRKFRPSSFGPTDADGNYRLMRRPNQSGVVLGLHHVRVTPVEQEGGKNTVVHPRYQANNALWADVVAGDNTIDFELRKDPTAPIRKPATE